MTISDSFAPGRDTRQDRVAEAIALCRCRTMLRLLMAVLSLACGVRSLLAQNVARPAPERPNILFIAVDDLRPALGCYGDTLAKSPSIDRLALSARRFDRAYTQQAVCGPSRTSLLTGLLPDHTRVWHNRNRFRDVAPDQVTLPQLFKQNGYRAVSLGKVFSGDERESDPDSWSEPEVLKRVGWKNYLLPENQGSGKHAAWEAADVDDEAYPDGKLAALAIQRLGELHRESQPFFLAVGFFKPHLPFNAPKKYWDLYDPVQFELADDGRPVAESPMLALHTHRELGGYRGIPEDEQVDAAEVRRLRHGYYACISYVDAQVGKLLAELARLQLDRQTIVVLWGDHGFSLGESGRWCKGTNFERDTRVPLMIRTPDLAQPGVASNALVQLVDLYPTLAELAGFTAPENLDGQSLVPILNDPQAPGRDVVLSQFNRPWKATVPGRRPPRNRWATRSGQPHTATHAGSTGPTAQRWRRNFTTTRRRTACGAWIRV